MCRLPYGGVSRLGIPGSGEAGTHTTIVSVRKVVALIQALLTTAGGGGETSPKEQKQILPFLSNAKA